MFFTCLKLSFDYQNLTGNHLIKVVSFHVSFHVKFGNMGCCDFSINNPQNSYLVTLLLTWNITFWVKYSLRKLGVCWANAVPFWLTPQVLCFPMPLSFNMWTVKITLHPLNCLYMKIKMSCDPRQRTTWRMNSLFNS